MAAQQPFQPKPNSARHPEPFNRFVGIARTRRLEAATSREKDSKIRVVEAQREQRGAHRNGSLLDSCRDDLCRGGLQSALLIASGHRRIRGRTKVRPYTLFSRRNKSAVSAANSARATELFG